MEIVSALCAKLADMVGTERFETWFGASTRLALDGDSLLVRVPTRFYQDFIRRNFRAELATACQAVLGRTPELQFCIDTEVVSANGDAAPPRTTGAVAPSAEPPAPARQPFGDLDSFVSGEGNRLALASAEMAVRQPGQMTPLLIYGPTGVGKSHLLQAIWTAVRKSRRMSRVVYLSAEQFTSGFLEALRGSGLPSFRRKYRGLEVLLLDDLQFLAGKRATQVELLHTIDDLLREGRQLVFAADRPAAALTELGAELTARLDGGMVCRIDPPDYATRLGILERMARRWSLNLPRSVQEFVAARLCNHARELSGALCRLQAGSRSLGRPIDLPMAEEALADMIQHSSRVVRLPDIEKAVCEVLGVEASSLQSDCKSKNVSHPRMLAMWLARKHTRAALCEIGDYFGRRTHSTVISAQKRIDQWLSDGTRIETARHDWKLEEAIRQVEKRLVAS
jgi:chromosomal replication initiator protein